VAQRLGIALKIAGGCAATANILREKSNCTLMESLRRRHAGSMERR
jgi:hypothetical protein